MCWWVRSRRQPGLNNLLSQQRFELYAENYQKTNYRASREIRDNLRLGNRD
ncbi:hypothetical protein OGM63_26495 [Plectonema radiosum NIES-515]|uniref:Uncharacterized protein n=1 Tax=Plectonema radiosum NIES-515 TaxID=2986073 RepID=A0ABT3B802_9CYAN|nr:hypothetical protein [Plectonema radiosum]MCV3217014.1 hypothetical protein [Plectonema radiosum NIES-515]